MKRILLFVATNIAVMVVLSIVIKVFDLDRMAGSSHFGLLVLSAVVGFSGAIISLLMSKWMAKHSTGAHVIDQP